MLHLLTSFAFDVELPSQKRHVLWRLHRKGMFMLARLKTVTGWMLLNCKLVIVF